MDLEAKVTALRQIGVGALVNQTLDKIIELELRRLIDVQEKLAKDLAEFEKRYQLSSEGCYRRFESGELGDAADFFEWTGIYEVYQSNESTLQQLKEILK